MRGEAVIFRGEAGQLRGERFGERGRPVLLLHGGGQTAHAWRPTALAMAAEGHVAYAIDQRGHGASDRAADGAYAFADYAADAAALLRAIADRHGEDVHGVGASLGGMALLLASATAPPLASLCLVDITPRMAPAGVEAIQGFMRERAGAGFASLEEAAEAVARYLPHRPRPPSREGLRKNLHQREDGRWYWHWDPAFLEGPRPINTDRAAVEERALAAAAALRVPTLLVRGRESELVTEAAARGFLALQPKARLVEIGRARHMVAGDSNRTFTEALLAFLREADTPGAVAASCTDGECRADGPHRNRP